MTARLWSVGSIRLRVAVAIALALTIEGLMRSNLNMAYVCMVSVSHLEPPKRPTVIHSEEECPVLTFATDNSTRTYKGTLEWSSTDRAYLFPMFYIGGLAMTTVTEPLDRKLGAARLVLYGAVVNVFGTLATPWIAVNVGPVVLSVVRFLMGAGQAVVFPCMSVLVARWFPVEEKSTALAIATTGNQLSVVLSMIVTAELCQWESLGGWVSAFYIYGLLGIVFCLLWYALVVDFPSEAKAISDEELKLLNAGRKPRSKPKPRWGVLLSSPVVWSICASSFCHNFVVVAFSSYLPFYYKSVHNMSLTSNGILCTVPFVLQFVSKVFFASMADWAKKRRWLSVTAATRISNSCASFGIAVSLFVMAYCDCSYRWTAVVAATTAMAFISGYVPGYNTSVVCVAPSQTAAISSFSRFWAQVGMSLSPSLIGIIVTTGNVEEWRYIFLGTTALCIATGIFFQCCGSASIQPWNNVDEAAAQRDGLSGSRVVVDPNTMDAEKLLLPKEAPVLGEAPTTQPVA